MVIAVRTLFLILTSLIKLDHLTKNARQLIFILKFNLNFILTAGALNANVRVKNLTQNTCSLFKRLRSRGTRCLWRLSGRKQRSKVFCRTNRQSFCNNLLSQLNARILIRDCENRTCMASSQFAFKNHLLNYLGKIEQTQ